MKIAHRESAVINFREVGSDFRWIDVKVFDITGAGSAREALPALVSDPLYNDDFASPSGALPDPAHRVHGPYSLDKITPASFERATSTAMLKMLRDWVELLGPLPARFERKIETAFADVLIGSPVIYRLLDLGVAARHRWGAHIGQHGFHEFVLVSTKSKRVTVLVASDD